MKIPTVPMVPGLILGNMLDGSLHQSLLIGDGSFLKSPISAGLLAVATWSLIQNTPAGKWLSAPVRAVFARKREE